MPEPNEAWIWLARIRRPQGRKGEVFAEILTDFPEKFAERRKLWLIAADGGSHQSPVPRGEGPGAPSFVSAAPRIVGVGSYGG